MVPAPPRSASPVAAPRTKAGPPQATASPNRGPTSERWPFRLEKVAAEGVDAELEFEFARPLTQEEELHDMDLEKVGDGRTWSMCVDMGSAPRAAEPLLDMVADFCRESELVRAGESPEDK